jgi:hypothetical protein
VCHILEVIDEAGDQAAAQITSESETGRDSLRPEKAGEAEAVYRALASPSCQYPHLPHEAAEETQHKVHQADLIGDLGGDGLLAVGTHRLHGRAFKDLSL